MNKKGITLIEVMVAMGLFAILSTLIVGAFVVVLNMKALTSTMKETQQKLRTSLELISRLGRQADRVEIYNSSNQMAERGQVVDLYFASDGTNPSATRFKIAPTTKTGETNVFSLYMQECQTFTSKDCTAWDPSENDLLDGRLTLDANSIFELTVTEPGNPPTLSIILNGQITNLNKYYQNEFSLENKVILENLPWSI